VGAGGGPDHRHLRGAGPVSRPGYHPPRYKRREHSADRRPPAQSHRLWHCPRAGRHRRV
jgi:hypothetical protein